MCTRLKVLTRNSNSQLKIRLGGRSGGVVRRDYSAAFKLPFKKRDTFPPFGCLSLCIFGVPFCVVLGASIRCDYWRLETV